LSSADPSVRDVFVDRAGLTYATGLADLNMLQFAHKDRFPVQ